MFSNMPLTYLPNSTFLQFVTKWSGSVLSVTARGNTLIAFKAHSKTKIGVPLYPFWLKVQQEGAGRPKKGAPPVSKIDDDAMMMTMAASSSRPKTASSSAARPASIAGGDDNDEEMLATLGKEVDKKEVEGPRPREGESLPLRSCVLGYQGDEAFDPSQTSAAEYHEGGKNCQHIKEIKDWKKVHIGDDANPPIHKYERQKFVWVARAKNPDGGQPRYTTNSERMVECPYFIENEACGETKQNTCDVCGHDCTETLFEFRCYTRAEPGKGARQAEIEGGERVLHPFFAEGATESYRVCL